jgi:hypothetical protein
MVFGVSGKLLFAQGKTEEAVALLQMALWHYEVAWDQAGKAKVLNNRLVMRPSAKSKAKAAGQKGSEARLKPC